LNTAVVEVNMKTLVIGCGKADRIFYNPLYVPKFGETLDDLPYHLGEAIREKTIVVEQLCSHDNPNTVTIDVEAIRCPDHCGSVTDLSFILDLEQKYKKQYFQVVRLENFPYSVLSGNRAGSKRFFHAVYYLLAVGGLLDLKTGNGCRNDGGLVALLEDIREAAFRDIKTNTSSGVQITALA
jgi:hypothetical protein